MRNDLKVLFVRLSSLGDVVLLTPCIEIAKRERAEVHVLIKKAYEDVFLENPFVDYIHTVESSSDLFRRIPELRGKFNIVFDMHRKIPTFVLRNLIGGKVYIWKRDALKRWIALFRKDFSGVEHTLSRYLHALAKAGFHVKNPPKPKIFVRRKGWAEAGENLKVGMAPGARWSTKAWKPEGFAEVAKELGKSARVFLFGDENQKSLCDLIAQKSGALNFAGSFRLKDVFALISAMDVFVANDSGLMHAACAIGVPTVAIFCSTTPEMGFSPIGETKTIQVEGLGCRPCSLHGKSACPKVHFKCADIDPKLVVKAVEDFLTKLS